MQRVRLLNLRVVRSVCALAHTPPFHRRGRTTHDVSGELTLLVRISTSRSSVDRGNAAQGIKFRHGRQALVNDSRALPGMHVISQRLCTMRAQNKEKSAAIRCKAPVLTVSSTHIDEAHLWEHRRVLRARAMQPELDRDENQHCSRHTIFQKRTKGCGSNGFDSSLIQSFMAARVRNLDLLCRAALID